MTPPGYGNLPSLTGLRWIAALLVFGYHLNVVEFFGPGVTDSVVNAVFHQGSAGVSFFFVLSGFILMWSSPRTPKARFWYRRFARVYPLHAVTAVLALVFLVLWKPQEMPTPLAGIANLTLTQSWFPDV
ncbi:MAG TPA: acyltransferase family protein, partial [Actinoplanes sp.]|nr:acyltransferase family protein [Actinoplanes sp.]